MTDMFWTGFAVGFASAFVFMGLMVAIVGVSYVALCLFGSWRG